MNHYILFLTNLAWFSILSAQTGLTNDSASNEPYSLNSLTETEAIAYLDALLEDSLYFELGAESNWVQSIEIIPIFGQIRNPLYSSFNPEKTNVRGQRMEGFFSNIPKLNKDKWLVFYELEKLNYIEDLDGADGQEHYSLFVSRANKINSKWSEATEIFHYYSESALDLALEDQLGIQSKYSEIILGSITQKFQRVLSSDKVIKAQLGIKNIQLLDTSSDFNEYSVGLKYLIDSTCRQLEISLFNLHKDYLFENDRYINGIGFSAKASFDLSQWISNSSKIKLCKWDGNSDGYDDKMGYRIENESRLIYKDWDIDFRLFYSNRDYDERYLVNNEGDDNAFNEPYHFNTYGINLTAEKKLNDSLDLIIQYDNEKNRSQSSDENYNIEKILLSLRYTFL